MDFWLSLDCATIAVRHAAHLATTVLPRSELQKRPFPIAAAIMEIANPAQRKATESGNRECIRDFSVCPMHAADLWGCFVLTVLISLLHDAVKHFLNLPVLSYCKIAWSTA